jgi:hypothetical protein
VTLVQLQGVLQGQVDASGAVSVSGATLTSAALSPRANLDAVLRGQLVLGTNDLTVAIAGKISAPTGDTLVVSGTAAVLGVAKAPATVTFTAPGAGPADVQVAIALPDGWTLGASFAILAAEPFSELTLANVRYVVTTMPTDTYTWNGATQQLSQGSELFSIVTTNGPLAVAVALLKGASTTDTAPLTGKIDPSALTALDAGIPVLSLSATLGYPISVTTFALSAPRVEIVTGSASDGTTVAWLAFATTLSDKSGKAICDFDALVSSGATTVTFALTETGQEKGLTPEAMIELVGVDYRHAVPDLLSEAFEAVSLQGLSATFSIAGGIALQSISAQIGSTGSVGYGQFELESVTLGFTAIAPIGTGSMDFSFDAKARLFEDVFGGEFDVQIDYDLTTRDVTVSASYVDDLPLSQVAGGLSGGSVSVPQGLELTLSEFGATLAKPAGGTAQYTVYATAKAASTLPFLGVHVDGELQLLVDSSAKRYEVVGTLLIGESAFTVTVDLTADDKKITGQWQTLGTNYLGIEALAQAIGIAAPEIPAGLDLDLDSATIAYDVTKSILTLEAESKNYGKAVLVALKSATWSFFFGLDINHRIGLSDIPIVGSEISKVVSVAIDDIEVLASSQLDGTAADSINGQIAALGGGYPQVPAAGMSGVALAMVFDAGGEKTTLTITAPPSTKQSSGRAANPLGTALLPSAEAPLGDGPPPQPSSGTVWLTLQKSFGPVAFQKVGIRYQNSVLYFLMNASVSAGGLSIAVIGLGVGSPLTTFTPKFTIDGLAVTYAEGPVELSGALVGSIDPTVDFYGELVLGVEELQIAALGGYCEVEGHPSFFLYAVLDYPIGGPAFFFVTGLAAGFGFNRNLVIPSVDGVATFPLVQWAQGAGNPPPMDTSSIADAVTKVIGELSSSGVIAPAVGEYWLAAGVRFTSFELVQSFALLTVEFGTQFEVALLGLSTLQLPPAPAPPVALAQLELEAVFIPAEGLLSISGELTPQSFVLSKDCHLTGGFALSTWFTGDNAGQFVVTLGGYSPRFTPPPDYPKVPRLGLNWQVTPELVITGDLYFALTSSAVMAGGGLSAIWQSGDINAWFDVEADFLLVFEPFHYYISAGIHLGASFTIDLLFTSARISIHLGVDLEIWGPEFAGKATIDLSIISFTITFGATTQNTDTTIGWGEFVDKLIPSQGSGTKARKPALAAAAEAGAAPAVVQVVVQAGLSKRLTDDDGKLNWVVNGEQLQLLTQTAIPLKEWSFSPNVTLAPGSPTPNTAFGVGPVGVLNKDLTSTHTISVTTVEASTFHAAPALGNVPAALWQTRQFDSNGVPVGLDPLNSTTVERVASGFTITPFVAPPHHTLPIKLQDLEYTIADPIKRFDWTDATAPSADTFTDQTVWGTIATAAPEAVRSALVNEIAKEGWSVFTTIDVSELSSQAAYDLLADPVLRLLGEQR